MDIKEKMKQVPFGNSCFQIQNFIGNQESTERSYRHILLQLDAKNKAMKECYFRRKRKEILIREITEKIETASGFDKERLLVDFEEAEFYLEEEIKLIEDCVIEIKMYEKLLEGLPDFSREDFENSEMGYWKKRLFADAERELLSSGSINTGTLQSLEKIGVTFQKDEKGRLIAFGNIPEIENNQSNKKE